jgi:hypothetical protein
VNEYEKPMKEFLNKAMKKNQLGETKKTKFFFNTFPLVTSTLVKTLGEKPFHLKRRLNVSALDAVMVVLLENFDHINPATLRKNYFALIESEDFIESITKNPTDSKTVIARVEIVKLFLIG